VLFLPKGNIFYFFHLIGMTRVFFFCDILEKCHNFNNHENCWFMKSSSGNLWAMIWIRYNYNTNTHEAYNQETNTLQNVRIQYSRSVYSLSVYSLETCTLQNVYSLNNMTLFVSFLYVVEAALTHQWHTTSNHLWKFLSWAGFEPRPSAPQLKALTTRSAGRSLAGMNSVGYLCAYILYITPPPVSTPQ
jgi:hypothetical protein